MNQSEFRVSLRLLSVANKPFDPISFKKSLCTSATWKKNARENKRHSSTQDPKPINRFGGLAPTSRSFEHLGPPLVLQNNCPRCGTVDGSEIQLTS